ncbi:hypothetical protein X474_11565 [Dethiosulfatarculus sandiegensis]|uniref:Uncharacterized protein n=1 Tax=Dethiosulfatarculus sandiegensis TaxID=1429043 RepID=A0A0D2GG20_9BACT|nr:hypothetical protein X474_11565 [Dethiosulfatarculus sandiegensis]
MKLEPKTLRRFKTAHFSKDLRQSAHQAGPYMGPAV